MWRLGQAMARCRVNSACRSKLSCNIGRTRRTLHCSRLHFDLPRSPPTCSSSVTPSASSHSSASIPSVIPGSPPDVTLPIHTPAAFVTEIAAPLSASTPSKPPSAPVSPTSLASSSSPSPSSDSSSLPFSPSAPGKLLSQIKFREYCDSVKSRLVLDSTGRLVLVEDSTHDKDASGKDVGFRRRLIRTLLGPVRRVLLPVNYPESVHPVYFRLSAIAMCEVILHAFVRVLASQALLTGVGVGETAAGAGSTAVAVRWLAKDGLAELAKLYFTHTSSASFDAYPKTWKLCAEGFGHISTCVLLSTILFPASYFVPVAAVGATFHSMYALAWYATHVNFMRALAVRHNISDVTARSDSQTVVADTIGLVLGMSVLHMFGGEASTLFTTWALCLPLHFACNYYYAEFAEFGHLNSDKVQRLSVQFLHQAWAKSDKGSFPRAFIGELPKTKQIDYSKITKLSLPRSNEPIDFQQLRAPFFVSELQSSRQLKVVHQQQREVLQKMQHIQQLRRETKPNPLLPLQLQYHAQQLTSLQKLQYQHQLQHTRIWHGIHPPNPSPHKPSFWHRLCPPLGRFYEQSPIGHEKFSLQDAGLKFDLVVGSATITDAFESERDLTASWSVLRSEKYLLSVRPKKEKIYIVLHRKSRGPDVMQAIFHATIVAARYALLKEIEASNIEDLLLSSYLECKEWLPSFQASLKEAGNLDGGEVSFVDRQGLRASWLEGGAEELTWPVDRADSIYLKDELVPPH